MNTHIKKPEEENKNSASNTSLKKQRTSKASLQFMNNRSESVMQKNMQLMIDTSTQVSHMSQLQANADNYISNSLTVQKKENNTGLPNTLKLGLENLSGISLDDVKVHRNSSKPAQLKAHAYAQGNQIHLAPGQEQQLPHEAWHVIQQKQGKVNPTVQMKGNIAINDDASLENEADIMGAKALQMKFDEDTPFSAKPITGTTVQRKEYGSIIQMALPISKADFRERFSHEIEHVDGEDRNPLSVTIFTNLDYVTKIVLPYLGIRKQLIKQYASKAQKSELATTLQKLTTLYGFWKWAKDNANCELFKILANNEAVTPLIQSANDLTNIADLPDMKDAHALAGGYKEDTTIRGDMGKLQRTLTNLAGAETMHTGTPAIEALPVPVIEYDVFMKSKNIPPALKKLVIDIYVHWKSGVVFDKKTATERANRSKTPDGVGSLRTWHMNGHASLPQIEGDPTIHPLHDHYTTVSQPGNVHDGGAPIGYAEYTGIDSDQNKIILNYINGHIFVTAIHYQYWYDMDDQNPQGVSGSLSNTKGQIPQGGNHDQIKSPWVRLKMH